MTQNNRNFLWHSAEATISTTRLELAKCCSPLARHGTQPTILCHYWIILSRRTEIGIQIIALFLILQNAPRNWSSSCLPKVLRLPPSPPNLPSDPVAIAAFVFSPSSLLLIASKSSPLFRGAIPTIHPGMRHRIIATGNTSFLHECPTTQPTNAHNKEPGN